MNYKRIYDNIINNRLNNPLNENEYGEVHHITPRSLGGSDSDDNLIRLTAREHFICHALLAEMYEEGTNEWYKMNHAFMMMKAISENQLRYINSRLYEYKRKDFSKVMSESQMGSNNSQYGKIWIHNLEKEKSIKILKNDVEPYLRNGWAVGRRLKFNKKKKVNIIVEYKGISYKKITLNRLNKSFNIGINFDNFYSTIKKFDDKLYDLYINNEYSTVDIANMYGVTDPTILVWLKRFNIPTRSKSYITERILKKKINASVA